ncbi:histone-lysine N-methyltransferase ASHR1 [Impatiens glandulifera]|uniref:histone-lysine N-methyltransferase ASHR1 n=1 Tax=Impatiens glandulifera TaxID=253017 RepID=UPI001FB1974E|nr:histone-lysine N-methyltransferase ASHR1 [Impatiens glandulifera]
MEKTSATMEDLQTALSTRGLTVSSHPDKGRRLLSTRDFSPGEVILSEEPYVSVPNKESSARCELCFKSTNVKKCSACQFVLYCGNACQKLDWKLHRLECGALSNIEKDRLKCLTPSIRLMVKLYLRRRLENEKVIPSTHTANYSLVEAMVSHISEISENQLVLYAQMANLVNLILQMPDINIKGIAQSFSKLACNAHTISDWELRPLGTGLYTIVAIINHSCLPNSVLVFEGRLAVIRAVQHVPKGSEILISYIETAGSTMTRQIALKEQYFFRCSCPCCVKMGQPDDIRESAILEGYRCKDSKCDGFLIRDSDDTGFTCQFCGLIWNKEDIMIISSEMKSMSEKASKLLSNSRNAEASATYKMVENLQVKLYHRFSIKLMRTREDLLKVMMEMKDWKQALAYCKLTIPVYERVYPELHPCLGLQYYTCGKLEWLLGETENAIRSLTKAADILRITHGSSSGFVKELAMKLEEAHAEASYNSSKE